jgi:single-stranded-DNA-specific exonuclease
MDDPLWMYPKTDETWRSQIMEELKCHPAIAQFFVSRQFSTLEEIHHYLYGKLPELHDPFLFSQMPQAVQRICRAVELSEPILIYGDNDVDGMTGTALLYEFLQHIGAVVHFHLSTRTSLKQGMLIDALDAALKNHCKLFITVDCGITAAAELARLAEHQIDVIITDHHEPTAKLPEVAAILNPKLALDPYPNKHLTGVGVAFKFAHAITNHLSQEGLLPPRKIDLKKYLDLVALGTVSDMGALVGENRVLVRYGIRQLRRTKRIGLAKLLLIAEGELQSLDTMIIASKIAPRLNSLGRIADPAKGVELLLIRDAVSAEKLAIELDLFNLERQKIERTMAQDVEEMFDSDPHILDHKAIVLSSEQWHSGVIAILSTRISKMYNRPTVMIAVDDHIGKGSIRSIPEFPVIDVLKECSDLLINFGGHDFAAGLSIPEEKIAEFKTRFIKKANDTLSDSDVRTKLYLDAQLSFDELTFDFIESMKLLEPFGNENPQPLFYCHVKQVRPPKIIGKTHLKLYLEQNDRILEGIALGLAKRNKFLRKPGLSLKIAFTPQVNNFQKKASIQLLIRDFQIDPS